MIKVIDLFSGVGGMSLGAAKAGFAVAGAVELDPIAINTHSINFPKTKHLQLDISTVKGHDLLDYFDIKKGDLFGVIGGPPCQGFSYMGKQKIDDPRNMLFNHFFRLVNELQPLFFVAENVPGILDKKYDDVREHALSIINKKFEVLPHVPINAKDAGAPTTRTRIFFIGFNKAVFSNVDVALSFIINSGNQSNKVEDALAGLPEVNDNKNNNWVEINRIEGTYAENISRIIPEQIGNYTAIKNWTYHSMINGMIGTEHSQEIITRFSNILPGGVDKISRSQRLKLDGFCPTLRAGTGSDKGSFQAVRPIHPTANRVITPREAARLQGFPDWFQFHQTKWHSFRQIGNSVSPIVSEFILRKILQYIDEVG